MSIAPETSPGVIYRHCETESDYAACIALQAATWGADDVVPVNLLKASRKIGGILAGAFDLEGRLLGFVFGISGIRGDRRTHWSHMLAVLPEARGFGLGFGLKTFQRDALIAAGFDHMRWTYDPMEAVNAHFNINRLGARPIEYILDMYGDGETNLLHRGIGTDRFIIEWNFARSIEPSNTGAHAPVINQFLGSKFESEAIGATRAVRIEVPRNIQQLKVARPDEARIWRASTRDAFQRCLAAGYVVTGFELGDRSYYTLELDT